MKKILSLLLFAIMLLSFTTTSAAEISTSGPVISDESNNDFSKQISAIKDMVMSMPHNIKYDMPFVVGRLSPSGTIISTSNSIVTDPSEPLEYDFDISLKWNSSLYNFYLGLYNDDSSFKTYTLISGGSYTIQSGTKFCLWFQYKDTSVKIDSIYNDIFYSLDIVSLKDVVYRDTFFKEGIFATEMPLDCLKEIYLQGTDNKEIIVGQIRKNFLSASGKYWTTLYLAYKDTPTEWIAGYLLQTTKPANAFDTDVPIKLTEYNGSGVSGYAIVDYNQLEDGYVWQPRILINMYKATKLAYNPLIQASIKADNNTSKSDDDTPEIVKLNKDVEHLVMQASKSRSSKFGDTLVPLEFVHITDIHAHKTEWNRVVEYIDEYEEYIDFAIHTGDYCGTSVDNMVDLYSLAKPEKRVIYNMVGNHDTYRSYASGETPKSATTEETYNAVFSDIGNWDVTFGDEAYATYYYKDFNESGIRLIVLNDQQWSDAQGQWLSEILVDANQKGLAVITASHMSTGYMATPIESSFTPVDDNYSFAYKGGRDIEPYIVEFKNNGGEHISHLCGHNHFDNIGYTKEGTLNIQLESTSGTIDARLESVRVEGTKSFDCFNVMAVDVNTKRIKIVRIGCNSNAALQGKTVLCYDYENKKVISNY